MDHDTMSGNGKTMPNLQRYSLLNSPPGTVNGSFESTDPLTPVAVGIEETPNYNETPQAFDDGYQYVDRVVDEVGTSINGDSVSVTDVGTDVDVDASDIESSISFDLYDEEFVRARIISQIKQEQTMMNGADINLGAFLLKYYKYRDLSDLSNGLGGLITGIDNELIDLVNANYLSFINLGKSIDGSLDLIHDIKIDLSDYLKNLKLSNEFIDKDMWSVNKIQKSRNDLIILKSIVKRTITLSEMIECFDRLCSKFDEHHDREDMLKELVGLYFGINNMFLKTHELINRNQQYTKMIESGILFNLSKKMNGLKLEFKSLLDTYLRDVKKSNSTTQIFEIFQLFQLLNHTQDI
jgi:conserved oligomeric Golgi complex subunit 2